MVKVSVKTVAEVAALSAKAMITTVRVGDPEEDGSMVVMRPVLSQINLHGFVTIDSQMGLKEVNMWQRAYVSGFISKRCAAAILTQLRRQDGLLVLTFPHGESMPPNVEDFAFAHMPWVPLTLSGKDLKVVTRQPLGAAQTWSSMWGCLLPEVNLKKDWRSRDHVMRDAVQLFVVDLTWGRKTWLFGKILKVLQTLE